MAYTGNINQRNTHEYSLPKIRTQWYFNSLVPCKTLHYFFSSQRVSLFVTTVFYSSVHVLNDEFKVP